MAAFEKLYYVVEKNYNEISLMEYSTEIKPYNKRQSLFQKNTNVFENVYCKFLFKIFGNKLYFLYFYRYKFFLKMSLFNNNIHFRL